MEKTSLSDVFVGYSLLLFFYFDFIFKEADSCQDNQIIQ